MQASLPPFPDRSNRIVSCIVCHNAVAVSNQQARWQLRVRQAMVRTQLQHDEFQASDFPARLWHVSESHFMVCLPCAWIHFSLISILIIWLKPNPNPRGGNALYDGKQYHLYVSAMTNQCPLSTWGQNSRIVSPSVLTPVSLSQVAIHRPYSRSTVSATVLPARTCSRMLRSPRGHTTVLQLR